jgi:hypothetical protein
MIDVERTIGWIAKRRYGLTGEVAYSTSLVTLGKAEKFRFKSVPAGETVARPDQVLHQCGGHLRDPGVPGRH